MNIQEQMQRDLVAARKTKATEAKNGAVTRETTVRVQALQLMLSEFTSEELTTGETLTDKDVTKKLKKAVTNRRENAEQYTGFGNTEKATIETLEAEVLGAYLPTGLTENETIAVVENAIDSVGAESKADMGKVMKELKNVDGLDMKTASVLVREKLN